MVKKIVSSVLMVSMLCSLLVANTMAEELSSDTKINAATLTLLLYDWETNKLISKCDNVRLPIQITGTTTRLPYSANNAKQRKNGGDGVYYRFAYELEVETRDPNAKVTLPSNGRFWMNSKSYKFSVEAQDGTVREYIFEPYTFPTEPFTLVELKADPNMGEIVVGGKDGGLPGRFYLKRDDIIGLNMFFAAKPKEGYEFDYWSVPETQSLFIKISNKTSSFSHAELTSMGVYPQITANFAKAGERKAVVPLTYFKITTPKKVNTYLAPGQVCHINYEYGPKNAGQQVGSQGGSSTLDIAMALVSQKGNVEFNNNVIKMTDRACQYGAVTVSYLTRPWTPYPNSGSKGAAVNFLKASYTVTGLDLISKPNKLDYKVGETFDPTGLLAKCYYSDSTTENLEYYRLEMYANSVWIYPGYKWQQAGEKNIVIKSAGKSFNFKINVGDGNATQEPEPVQVAPTNSKQAAPTNSKIFVNGKATAFEAYTIDNSNYFKLRDLALAINGTPKKFDVTFNNDKNAIDMKKGMSYTAVGGELAPGDGKAKSAEPTTSEIYIDGTKVDLTAFNINGSNYFKLRDVMKVFDVYVGWNEAENTVTLDTGKNYDAK